MATKTKVTVGEMTMDELERKIEEVLEQSDLTFTLDESDYEAIIGRVLLRLPGATPSETPYPALPSAPGSATTTDLDVLVERAVAQVGARLLSALHAAFGRREEACRFHGVGSSAAKAASRTD